MKENMIAFIVGLLFALGLGIGGMTQPQNIIGFLDFTGSWSPALMGVMGGAVLVYMMAYRIVKGMPTPLLGGKFGIPTKTELDRPLLLGAALFGIGWGMSGFCPGPAIVSLVTGAGDVLAFTASMGLGMLLFKQYDAWRQRRHV